MSKRQRDQYQVRKVVRMSPMADNPNFNRFGEVITQKPKTYGDGMNRKQRRQHMKFLTMANRVNKEGELCRWFTKKKPGSKRKGSWRRRKENAQC